MQVLIKPIEKNLVLQARGSELVILDEHVAVLKGLKKSKEFIEYFRHTALVNRPARKLFEAWLRKDGSLWKRIYESVGGMDDVEIKKVDSTTPVEKTFVNTEKQKARADKESAPVKKREKPKKVAAKPAKQDKKAEPVKKSKPAAEKVAKKTAKKTAKKVAKKTTKKVAKKATKKVAKKTAKKTTKKKSTTKKKK
jgi:hypothetical protein